MPIKWELRSFLFPWIVELLTCHDELKHNNELAHTHKSTYTHTLVERNIVPRNNCNKLDYGNFKTICNNSLISAGALVVHPFKRAICFLFLRILRHWNVRYFCRKCKQLIMHSWGTHLLAFINQTLSPAAAQRNSLKCCWPFFKVF